VAEVTQLCCYERVAQKLFIKPLLITRQEPARFVIPSLQPDLSLLTWSDLENQFETLVSQGPSRTIKAIDYEGL